MPRDEHEAALMTVHAGMLCGIDDCLERGVALLLTVPPRKARCVNHLWEAAHAAGRAEAEAALREHHGDQHEWSGGGCPVCGSGIDDD